MNGQYWIQQISWFAALGAVFWLLSRRFAVARLPSVPLSERFADLTYWFLFPLLYGVIYSGMMTVAAMGLFWGDSDKAQTYFAVGVPALRALPIWVQAVLVLIITDFYMYWVHRAFHKGRLWKYHAIHHAPKSVDWLTCVRFHPVNVALYATAANVLVILLGFSPMVLAFLAPFNIIWSALVHANLNWDFGPFRYVLASPVFHRWHHSDVVIDKNYAATFPVLDLMFGTFYMPKNELPLTTGTPHDPVPDTLWGQMAYPFLPRKAESTGQNLPENA